VIKMMDEGENDCNEDWAWKVTPGAADQFDGLDNQV